MAGAANLYPALFVLLWATGFIGARYAMPWAEPFTFLALRFGIAMVLLYGLMWLTGARAAGRRGAAVGMVAGALMHGVYLGGVFWAVRHGMSAGLAALIVGLQPLITAIMAGFLIGERVLPRHWAGLAIGFAGVVIVLWPKLGTAVDALAPAALAATFIGVVGMSAGTIWQKRFAGGTDLMTSSFWQYVGATILTAALSLTLETRAIEWTGELVFALVWLVLVLSIGAIVLLMHLIRMGSVSRVASLFYLVPAVTALLAWPLFGETLVPLQLAGMAIATVGVALASRS